MTHFFLVRHGETIWHEENRYAGRTDIDLTERGLLQAQELGEWARTADLSAVWSSPLTRARRTAQPAADAAGLSLEIEDRLVELDFGRAEGLTGAEMDKEFPAERIAFLQNPVAHYLPGGENPVKAAQRGVQALQEIERWTAPNARVLIVGHSTLFRLMLCDLLGIPLAMYRQRFPRFDNGALTEIVLQNGSQNRSAALLSFNAPLRAQPVSL